MRLLSLSHPLGGEAMETRLMDDGGQLRPPRKQGRRSEAIGTSASSARSKPIDCQSPRDARQRHMGEYQGSCTQSRYGFGWRGTRRRHADIAAKSHQHRHGGTYKS